VTYGSHRTAFGGERIKFADGMSVKLPCERETLEAWWLAVSARNAGLLEPGHATFCEAFK
jgi:hypothetical protein